MRTLLTFLSCFSVISACSLVPNWGGLPPSTCQSLRAVPYIIFNSTQYGPFIEGASVNHLGHVFATNFGNADTRHQMGQRVNIVIVKKITLSIAKKYVTRIQKLGSKNILPNLGTAFQNTSNNVENVFAKFY